MTAPPLADPKPVDLWRDLIFPLGGPDAWPKQVEFLQASLVYRYLLFGGSRYPGKSRTLRWGLVWRLIRWFKKQGFRGVRVGLFSKDYPTLEDRQITKIEAEFPRWLGELKSTKTDGLAFYLAPEYGEGKLLLRNLDDPAKYVGAEMAGMAVDEVTENPRLTFDTMRGSLRWPGIEDTFWWGATNPYGEHLLWVRQLWVERDFPPELAPLKDQFHFVSALPTDNPTLTQSYWMELAAQPAHIQRAWLHGDWYVVAGGMFDELTEPTHRVPDSLPRDETAKIIGMDWGWTHQTVALWVETDAGVGRPPRSRVYREYVTSETHPELVAQEIVNRSLRPDGSMEPGLRRIVLDSAAWASPQDGGPSPAEQMLPTLRRHGLTLEPSVKGPRSRQHGWVVLHTYFAPRAGGPPLLTISRGCRRLWDELTTCIHAERDPEDVENHETYDCLAALRYWASSRPAPPPPTWEDLVNADPHAHLAKDPRSWLAAKLWADERRQVAEFKRRGFPAVPVRPAVRPPQVSQKRYPWS